MMNNDAVNQIANFVSEFSGDEVRNDFMLYEPWDVEERPEWIFKEAEKKHVDLRAKDFTDIYGPDPHMFQTGYMYYREFIVAIFGGNQIGKSYCAMMDLIIMMTGEIPYAMRYEKGHDTGILRECSPDNIRRFGRYSTNTGEYLDNDDTAEPNGSWNCGTIKGVGTYPKEKIAPRGQKAWLGTFSQAKEEYWWPRLKKFIPEYMIDTSRGNKGFSERSSCIYLNNDNELHVITYEQGYAKFEAENVWVILLDEEPPDQRIFTSAIQHISQGGVGVRLIETPYRGLTWTFDLILKRSLESKDVRICHATQFDSPYQNRKMVLTKMKLMKPWEIEARVFGVHSEQKGRPYYNRERINRWLRSHNPTHKLREFICTREWDNARDAMRAPVRAEDVLEKKEREEWEIYEEPMKGTPYWMSIDTGMGATEAEDAADRNAAHIMRPPIEDRNENLSLPVVVASIRSSIETLNFARLCLYAARYYNNALIAPESKGETAATFISEIRDYPFMFTMTVINDVTKKPTKKLGFDTNAKTRRIIFDLIGDFLNEVDHLHYPNIPHFYTLKELAEMVVAKKGRPDHPNGGTSDCAVAFGIGLYVWIHAKEQIRDNSGYRAEPTNEDYIDKWGGRVNKKTERRPVLGSKRGLDSRSRR
jgi:hypothetical protein